MSPELPSFAMGFALLRGFMLSVLTVPWVVQKMRRPDATQPERSVLWMVASRTILLGIAIVVLTIAGRREPLGWVLLGDGALQLFDTVQALAQSKRNLAILPAILCLADGCAGLALLR